MTTHKAPTTDQELLEAIDELLDAIPPEELADCDRVLAACGFDPKEVGKQLGRAATEALASSTLNWRVRAQAERAAALQRFEATTRSSAGSADELSARIGSLLAQVASMPEAPALRAHFHKLSGKASAEELSSLLAELEYLHSQLKNKKNSE